jgi:hypothetical protein
MADIREDSDSSLYESSLIAFREIGRKRTCWFEKRIETMKS